MAKTPLDIFKVNWDTFFDTNKQKIGVGVVIRDYGANVIGTLRAASNLINNLFVVESMALLLAT